MARAARARGKSSPIQSTTTAPPGMRVTRVRKELDREGPDRRFFFSAYPVWDTWGIAVTSLLKTYGTTLVVPRRWRVSLDLRCFPDPQSPV